MMKFIELSPENEHEHGFYCIKNPKNIAYKSKSKWYAAHYKNGTRIIILQDDEKKQVGFIEYAPTEFAWKPVKTTNSLLIQCVFVHSKKDNHKGYASSLVKRVEEEAKKQGYDSVLGIGGKGTWIPNGSLYTKLGFTIADEKGRFILFSKELKPSKEKNAFLDWEKNLGKYSGWNLIISYQCPYHAKAVEDLVKYAKDQDIDLQVHELKTAKEAQNGPSGFGTFTLLKDGVLLEDHYISLGRFKNILRDNN